MLKSNEKISTMNHHHVLHHHADPFSRHNVISVVYDNKKMEGIFGDMWEYHIEKIEFEPPEMKMLFALQMGFKVSADPCIVDILLTQREVELSKGTTHKFINAALDDDVLLLLSEKLGIEKDAVSVILEHAPEGVVSVVISAAKKK